MAKMLGSARRARKLARLFEALRRACDEGDIEAARAARRAIDAVAGRARSGPGARVRQ